MNVTRLKLILHNTWTCSQVCTSKGVRFQSLHFCPSTGLRDVRDSSAFWEFISKSYSVMVLRILDLSPNLALVQMPLCSTIIFSGHLNLLKSRHYPLWSGDAVPLPGPGARRTQSSTPSSGTHLPIGSMATIQLQGCAHSTSFSFIIQGYLTKRQEAKSEISIVICQWGGSYGFVDSIWQQPWVLIGCS